MIIDEEKLRKVLSFAPLKVVDQVIHELERQGLPVKVIPSHLELEIGENVHIKFANEPPVSKENWTAEIEGIDPIQIRSIKIPELTYDEIGLLTIDVSLYPFKFDDVFKGLNKKEENKNNINISELF